METEKVIIDCSKCGTRIRFPILEKRIRFSCSNCQEVYFAEKGMVITVEEPLSSSNSSPEEPQTETDLEPKEFTSSGISTINIQQDEPILDDHPTENQTEKAEPDLASTEFTVPDVSTDNIQHEEPILGNPLTENQIGKAAPRSGIGFLTKIFWQVSTGFFFLTSVICFFIILPEYSEWRKERELKDSITEKVILGFKNEKVDHFRNTKKFLTDETKLLVEAFIETQYLYNDSLSVKMVDHFLQSLTPLEYIERRKVSYVSTQGDTLFFYMDFVKNGETYLIKADTRDFLD